MHASNTLYYRVVLYWEMHPINTRVHFTNNVPVAVLQNDSLVRVLVSSLERLSTFNLWPINSKGNSVVGMHCQLLSTQSVYEYESEVLKDFLEWSRKFETITSIPLCFDMIFVWDLNVRYQRIMINCNINIIIHGCLVMRVPRLK
jgi:hypothetical protein